MPDRDDAWRCAFCGKHHAVPILARECERRHEDVQPESQREGVER